jgi:adenylate cyclase
MTERRLAAILVADVVGYSTLVGRDEAGTLAKLAALKRELIEPAIAKHSGRLFKAVGDGFLVEFASAVQAVACAVAIQKAGPSLPLRIGVHLGDVIVEGDDLMGDGVNIAARIESVAEAGGIAISRQVRDQVRDKLDIELVDKGEVELKNIARPVRIFTVAGARGSAPASLPLPDKPSIAVLPFQNMSGDPDQEYFVDGLVEDIITALSRDRGLFVSARNSSFTYKGRAVDIRQVGRELGVRYVLEGSVRKAGSRVRITGQLIEADSGTHIWADRFDGSLADIFELQDQVANKVASIISPEVEAAEMARATRKVTDLQAYDFFLRAKAAYARMGARDLDEALGLAEQAVALDPSFARAHALVADIYNQRNANSISRDPAADAAAAERAAQKALALDRSDGSVLTTCGSVLMFSFGRRSEALVLFDAAIELDPNLSTAWVFRAMCRRSLGREAEAMQDFEHVLRLDPRDPRRWVAQHALAWGHLMAGRYDDAVAGATTVLQLYPDFGATLRVAIAAHALAGRLDLAREVLARQMAVEPKASISGMRDTYVRRTGAEQYEKLVVGLRKAGFPE